MTSVWYFLLWLPVAVCIFHAARRMHIGAGALTALSIGFIAFIHPITAIVATTCVVWNYILLRCAPTGTTEKDAHITRQFLTFVAIVSNLFVLFAQQKIIAACAAILPSLAALGTSFSLSYILLGLIATTVETHQNKALPSFVKFLTGSLLFAKVMAGPIARGSEIFPQLETAAGTATPPIPWGTAIGYLMIGLCKKILIADMLAPFVDNIFIGASKGGNTTFYEAWFGSVGYGFQLYFDFSGYTDIAIGTALLFGLQLPQNFDAPYRAANISIFWRKWHMSLCRFIRDFVYIPLGGNRRGLVMKNLNLFISMILVGIWHGRTLPFVAWGAFHGILLILHSSLSPFFGKIPLASSIPARAKEKSSVILTFLAVTMGWVLFRADTLQTAQRIYESMFSLPADLPSILEWKLFAISIIPAALLVWACPTSSRILENFRPTDESCRHPGHESIMRTLYAGFAFCLGCLGAVAMMLAFRSNVFLYANF